ncbi:MAG TPA: pyrroline-5-carboxylate reductase [Tepidisphaeraceae bacterium]|nr:pyrroline-5-carboxylate reductase [Tepidisphaeraceae bacterium]
MTYELGILGAGNMAEAIVRGVLRAGVLTADRVIASDPTPARRELFERELGVRTTADNVAAAAQSSVLLLSVKPQQMADVLKPVGAAMDPGNVLVVSIAAGISSSFIERSLGGGRPWRVVRTMPNTPMLIGEGMVGLARGQHATADDVAAATRLFAAAADVVEVAEEKINAVTAVSGSGPAYVYFLVEQMVKAGVELGLTPEQAHQLATKTAYGAAKMMLHSTDAPAELRRKVTSPGGTTHAAITRMEVNGLPQTIVDALKAAERRGRELGV